MSAFTRAAIWNCVLNVYGKAVQHVCFHKCSYLELCTIKTSNARNIRDIKQNSSPAFKRTLAPELPDYFVEVLQRLYHMQSLYNLIVPRYTAPNHMSTPKAAQHVEMFKSTLCSDSCHIC